MRADLRTASDADPIQVFLRHLGRCIEAVLRALWNAAQCVLFGALLLLGGGLLPWRLGALCCCRRRGPGLFARARGSMAGFRQVSVSLFTCAVVDVLVLPLAAVAFLTPTRTDCAVRAVCSAFRARGTTNDNPPLEDLLSYDKGVRGSLALLGLTAVVDLIRNN